MAIYSKIKKGPLLETLIEDLLWVLFKTIRPIKAAGPSVISHFGSETGRFTQNKTNLWHASKIKTESYKTPKLYMEMLGRV